MNTVVQSEVLYQVLDALDSLEIPYMVTGSFASNFWGRPRFTHDADLVVEILPEKAEALARLLEGNFYAPGFAIREAAERRGHFNVICLTQPFKVDLWMRKETPYDRERFGRRRQVEMLGRRVWIASPEDTILSKLDWYRISPTLSQQFQDALGVYEIQEPNLDQTYLDHWASELGVADLLADIRRQAIRG